jgi:hypothetical protein
MSDMDELPVEERPVVGFTEEPRPKNVARALAGIAWGVAALALGAGVLVGGITHSQANNARKAQHQAEAALKTEKAKPPKVVTKTVTVTKDVPIFGRSVLMGAFAAGQIQGGIYDGAGNFSLTPNDSTCSQMYTQLSNQYTTVAIDRPTFMSACEGSLSTTLKKDTTS